MKRQNSNQVLNRKDSAHDHTMGDQEGTSNNAPLEYYDSTENNDEEDVDVADCSILPPSGSNSAIITQPTTNIAVADNSNAAPNKKKMRTLFTAVMSRSNFTSQVENTSNQQVVVNGAAESNKDDGNPEHKNLHEPNININIGNMSTPTRKSRSGGIGNNKISPALLLSPGGFEILKALDDVNNFSYHHHQSELKLGEDGEEIHNDKDDTAGGEEEWHDATVTFCEPTNKRSRKTNNNLADVMNAEKEQDEDEHFFSSIVEDTKAAFDLDDNKKNTEGMMSLSNAKQRPPEPMTVGFIDWSLKRRIRLQCLPGHCLPGVESLLSPKPSLFGDGCEHEMEEGMVHQLALKHLTRDSTSGKDMPSGGYGENDTASLEQVAAAKWLASTMYHQHPAVHPLPSSLLHEETGGKSTGNSHNSNKRKRSLSSYIHGPNSIYHRARLPSAGCMGGLGTSMQPQSTSRGGGNLGINGGGRGNRPLVSTVSSLLNQRRRDWQEAFRSMYQKWKSKLSQIEDCQRRGGRGQQSFNTDCSTLQDELSRCSFYSILPNQVILFRGVREEVEEVGNDDLRAKGQQQRIVPMIVFSSTTSYLRLKLKSLGVDLRLLSALQRTNGDSYAANAIFLEHFLEAEDVSAMKGRDANAADGDAESVHAELDAIKWADDEKGKITVDRKKKAQQNKYNAAYAKKIPPLYVSGDDDCAIVYELLLNTYGLTSGVPEGRSGTQVLDVPLLLCRSLGPCMHMTLRTLSVGSRRHDGEGNMNQQLTLEERQQQPSTSLASSASILELRGPILPCALRDLTCAMINWMLLDKYKHDEQQRRKGSLPQLDDTDLSSHQFAMFVQAHEGEWNNNSVSTTQKFSTGTSSSLHFNGSSMKLLSKDQEGNNSLSKWHECIPGDILHVLVWDVSRESSLSFSSVPAPK